MLECPSAGVKALRLGDLTEATCAAVLNVLAGLPHLSVLDIP